jgi:preprotein translocase subunit SecY
MALNIMPYITASIIMSLLEGTTPSLKKKIQRRRRRRQAIKNILC